MTEAAQRPALPADADEIWLQPPEFVLESDRLCLAFFVAARAHAGHTRGGHGRPYLEHPIHVARLLDAEGYGEATIAAALMHDVVEDSGLLVGDIVESFGVEVGELVAALTEDPAIDDWEQRKLAIRAEVERAGADAAAIYAADKLANVRDWRLVYAEVGERAVEFFKAPTLDARLRVWEGDLEFVGRVVGRLATTAQLRAELAAFEDERVQGRIVEREAGVRG